MTQDGIAGIVPARWVMPLWPVKYDQVIILNWLQVEIPESVPVPYIQELRGWRNREVFDYVSGLDWTAKMYV